MKKKREIVVTTGDFSRDQLWLDQYQPADLFQCRGCSADSLTNQLGIASLRPAETRLAQIGTTWLDDYYEWLRHRGTTTCCRLFSQAKAQCHLCTNSTTHEEVTEKEFRDYPSFFLHDNPNLKCPKGGHAAHGSSVKLYEHNGTVETSLIMDYHSVLISSADFIDAMQHAYRLVDNITATLRKSGHDETVFPYR